jgi:hypothetical protein
VEVRLSRPARFPRSTRWYVVAAIRTRYRPLLHTPSPIGGEDAATAEAEAMDHLSAAIDESYEAEQGWLTREEPPTRG